MTRADLPKARIAVLLAALAVFGAVAAYSVATAVAQGRTIDSTFCLNLHPFCLTTSFDGQAVAGYGATIDNSLPACGPTHISNCTPSGTGLLDLTPGTHWISATDNHNAHNIELRSCPGSTTACVDGPGAAADETEFSPICNDAVLSPDTTCGPPFTAQHVVSNTFKINLKPGTYRLFCDVPGHEQAGMYIDFVVAGVDQED
jgi:hypothetical protein